MNILFLNAGRRVELLAAFKKALAVRGGGLLFATDVNPLAPALYFADRHELMPRRDVPGATERLAAFCADNQIDLLIPTIDPDLSHLDSAREVFAKLAPDTKLLLSPSAAIRDARDKVRSRGRFRELGLETPVPIAPPFKNTDFPLFVKPPHGSAGEGAKLVSRRVELLALLVETPDLMVERFVDGDEITVDVLCDFAGQALAAIPRRRLQIRGGEVSRGAVERDPALETLAKKAAEGFGCHGPVTVQFRAPAPGVFVAMELNARMGGGLPLSIAAGADWPGWILDLVQGRAPNTGASVQDKLTMTRYDSSLFLLDNAPYSAAERRPPSPTHKFLRGTKAVVFDLDDTLYPERDFVENGHRAAAEKVWKELKVEIESDLRELFRSGRRGDLFSLALRQKGFTPGENYIKTLVAAYRGNQFPLRPFLDTSILPALREAGVKLGLLSDGWQDVQRRKLANLGMEHLFDAVVFSDALGGREFWKPSTKPFEAILSQLGVAPTDAIYVGDNPLKDFLGARRAGMKTVMIARKGGELSDASAPDAEHQADATIESLDELTPIFHGCGN